jgi:hypothetical protein
VKKTIVIGLSLLALLTLGSSLAMAYDAPEESIPTAAPSVVQGPNFIDQDGDGVCDLAGARHGFGPNGSTNRVCGENFIDEDGDGVCDLIGTGEGFGPFGFQNGSCGENFTDENGDGICDWATDGLAGTGQGTGPQGRMGSGQGRGWGRNAQGGGLGS